MDLWLKLRLRSRIRRTFGYPNAVRNVMRARYEREPHPEPERERVPAGIDYRKLEYIRWLVEHGRLNEDI